APPGPGEERRGGEQEERKHGVAERIGAEPAQLREAVGDAVVADPRLVLPGDLEGVEELAPVRREAERREQRQRRGEGGEEAPPAQGAGQRVGRRQGGRQL